MKSLFFYGNYGDEDDGYQLGKPFQKNLSFWYCSPPVPLDAIWATLFNFVFAPEKSVKINLDSGPNLPRSRPPATH